MIEKIDIKATEFSPRVIFDLENNIFKMKGKSVVTEADSFYMPLIDWLEQHENKFSKRLDFVFDFDYFNIFSSKRILFILYKLAEYRKNGIDVNVIWHFSIYDDDMKEVGEDFACMVNLPFEFISKTVQPELV